MDIQRKTLADQHYLYVEREAEPKGEAMAAAMGSGFAEVFGFTQKHGIERIGAPMSLYVQMPNGPTIAFQCGMFVSAEGAQKASGSVLAGVIPSGDVVTGVHVGPYANLNMGHKALWDYCDEQGYTKLMPVWEHYIDDPTTVDEAALRTELFRRVE